MTIALILSQHYLVKLVNVAQSYSERKSGTFYGPRCNFSLFLWLTLSWTAGSGMSGYLSAPSRPFIRSPY